MIPLQWFMFIITLSFHIGCSYGNAFDLDLHPEHLEYYFNYFPQTLDQCKDSSKCPYQGVVKTDRCWGYEPHCNQHTAYSYPLCPGEHKGWVKSKAAQFDTFYRQADFGYVKEQREEMTVLCEPALAEDSSLECSKHLRFCRGRNIFMDLTGLNTRKEPIRYKMDVLKHGQIGGNCKFNESKLKEEADHVSPLQSWAPEMLQFTQLSSPPLTSNKCDVIIDQPTYIMKIDATVNMYHHFCDFFNLYASQHVNASHPDVFSTDVHIMIWESYTYASAFADTFRAFTRHPVWDLKTFTGLTVCFKNLVLPLLPRMIYGLYYNTPLIWGCEKSGLMEAFSKHILHRLKVRRLRRKNSKVRITLLSRDTQYRNILNEQELIEALSQEPSVKVKRVVYNRQMNFTKQLEKTYNSDILIGMHGAGLTHLMFLPDWAVVFELYNCEDEHCYKDLARLRGIKYITWEDKSKLEPQDEGHHPNGGAHAKFTNYKFDVAEFVRLVRRGVKHVKAHSKFQQYVATMHDEL
ncbi:EGF domain-specific O-linked N-acetylglucosamine transferase isoform X2 [Diaphorina citri]|uniref:EGF domain-specific O-linked N-acetylglucosamine transferase n=1 Tax=Diaphorina citri TaxID=121845 RepID=A0A3Q0IY14_DIACI|nr:EGF domain-specific O-linked N-acetylglucosamine transferase isoform X2 [Diaphorina citri]XP_026681110.1 EGF domain-specific O-linked N-acetylglucosamine transferase isoform X2 [Diaphorina citri]